MGKDKVKVYIYTRVSTGLQVEGYSLDAQVGRIEAYAKFNDFEIVGRYEDAGKSGKSIEGRPQFMQMMRDLKINKDGAKFVLVFKLSRFGRNSADVLASLQEMQDYGVNLISIEEGIDSSKETGRLMIAILSAVAEMERENIRIQTMEGRFQKAREGRWNGGFAPYGYALKNGELVIAEEEAEAIRIIFDKYVNSDMGATGISAYLDDHGINKVIRQNGKTPLFNASFIRKIIQNPVYCGKIAYGRRRTEKIHGTRNDYHLVAQDDYLVVEGEHEALVSEELWNKAQVKAKYMADKYEYIHKAKGQMTHLLTGLIKCPICGAGMYSNRGEFKKKNGEKSYFYYYGCKHRKGINGYKCNYKRQIKEEMANEAVAEVITKLVSNPEFAIKVQEKINYKVDTAELDAEIKSLEKELKASLTAKEKLIEQLDGLDFEDKHYTRMKEDIENRIYKFYDKIERVERQLSDALARKKTVEEDKITGDNIYKVLIYFEELYGKMNDEEKRRLLENIISSVEVYEEPLQSGQWLKAISFKLPIIEEDMCLSLDKGNRIETVVLMSQN